MFRKITLGILSAIFAVSCFSAQAANVANIAITTAQSAQTTTPLQLTGSKALGLVLQGAFTYGSGGTSADAWVQVSVDGQKTWTDIADFHFTTASARYVFNLSALTPVTTEYTPTDGTLAANTAKDGILGGWLRVKYTTVGTYAGGTSLSVDVSNSVAP